MCPEGIHIYSSEIRYNRVVYKNCTKVSKSKLVVFLMGNENNI